MQCNELTCKPPTAHDMHDVRYVEGKTHHRQTSPTHFEQSYVVGSFTSPSILTNKKRKET